MPITLMDLPYPEDALAPAVSAETLRFHHGKHHKTYVEKTNALAAEAGLDDSDLETIVRTAKGSNPKLYNQAAQVWNHGFYWLSLTPTSRKPAGDLADRIAAAFGSHDAMLERFAAAATDHFGSGWAWLLAGSDGSLTIESTRDADCPLTGAAVPLLTVDVWEHAYYLDRQNDRKAYVKAVLDNLLDWQFAAENLDRGTAWTYPG